MNFHPIAGVAWYAIGRFCNLFPAALRSSVDFTHQGWTWNLTRLIPEGISQLGTAMELGGNVRGR